MSNLPPPLRRGLGERLLAWVVTGPLGHLWSVIADIGLFAGGLLLARVRRIARGIR